MSSVYCGDNCNHTGPHHYPPSKPDERVAKWVSIPDWRLYELEQAEEREARLRAAVDGLPHLVTDILRKYGGTMKGRGDHDIFDALVRYRAVLATTPTSAPVEPTAEGE